MSEMKALLGRAYETHQMRHQSREAISQVKEAIALPEKRKEAEAYFQNLNTMVQSRMQGGVCGCHVSKIQHEILSAALAAEEP